MWLPEDLRGKGYGQKLLEMTEDEDRKRKVKCVFLDISSFQASGFYKKFDYQAIGN